ncbi:MAG: hypothetical protein Q4G68_10445 [Planctomycetia bacterium]|nr:hypothetical protein [Planctomycetia bacterium]
MIVSRMTRTSVLCLCLALSLCYVAVAPAETLQEIETSACALPNRLRSYEFSFEARTERSAKKYESVDVQQSGSNIRVKHRWKQGEALHSDPAIAKTDYAFNGVDYQWFSPHLSILNVSKQCRHPTPYWTPSPLMYPYYWLTGQQANWSDTKIRETWQERFKAAKYIGTETEDGVEYEVVSFPFPQMNMDDVHVFFAKDLSYYPLRFCAYLNGKPVYNFKVTRYKTFDIDGGMFVFPLEAEMHIGDDENGFDDMFWTISEPSIQVNPDLDEDLFTIPPSRAKHFTDFDKELEKGVTPSFDVADDGRDIVHPELQPSPWRRGKIFVLVVLNLVIITFIVIRYKRKAG